MPRPKAATPQEVVAKSGDVQPTVIEPEAEPSDELTLDKADQQAAIASPMGGSDQYPYTDRTAIPLHERNMPAMGNSPLTEASQADLNPAFTPKAEDGGPVNENDEGVGTEPNAFEQQADAAERQGGTELREQVEAQQAEASKAQMDAQAVTDAAQKAAPEGIDGATGQPEGQVTPGGTPSGLEGSSDGEAGTQGASS